VTCSQVVDIEDLVIGTIESDRAAELRLHLRECDDCRAEAELVAGERALFEARAGVAAGPPPELAGAIRERLSGVSAPPAERVAVRLMHLFRRGHFSVACAAALFVVAALSRLGSGGFGTPMTAAASPDRASEASDMLASTSIDEPLACSLAPASVASNDDTSGAAASSASAQEVLACTPQGSRATCESTSSVTCATLRQ
jgi:hypothetical protein